jgi:O-antigen/teichoic acid export membrane protein
MQKELLFKQLALSQMISKTSSAVVGIGLAYAGFGVWALVWSMHTGAIMRGLMLLYQYHWAPEWHFNKLDLKKYWKVGSNVFYSGLLFNVTNRIDYLIIGKFFAPASLGMYSRAKENGFLPALIFGNIIRSTFLGIYAKLKTDTEKLKKMFVDSSKAIFLMKNSVSREAVPFPIEIAERCIKLGSNENEIVLDHLLVREALELRQL